MRFRSPLSALAAGTALSLVVAASIPAGATSITLDPNATFLRTNNDAGALDANAIDLAALGISAGDMLQLSLLGDYDAGPGGDTQTTLIGVFSSSSVLLGNNLQNRVQDAIDAGTDIFTDPTFSGGLATDIAEDFEISEAQPPGFTSIIIQVPTGATHLFVSARDTFYTDNSDPDADYGVEISIVPEPATALLLASGIAGLAAYGRRQRSFATHQRPTPPSEAA